MALLYLADSSQPSYKIGMTSTPLYTLKDWLLSTVSQKPKSRDSNPNLYKSKDSTLKSLHIVHARKPFAETKLKKEYSALAIGSLREGFGKR
jgi:hypothetical protein